MVPMEFTQSVHQIVFSEISYSCESVSRGFFNLSPPFDNCLDKHVLSVHFTYIQTETTLVCISDCCVVKVGVVFSVVDRFQCRSGILSGFNLNLVFLPKL